MKPLVSRPIQVDDVVVVPRWWCHRGADPQFDPRNPVYFSLPDVHSAQ